MEAVALYKYSSMNEDELSFKKGDILKVLYMTDGGHWCKAVIAGKEGLVPRNYIEMKPHPWFKDHLSKGQAEEMLASRDEPEGAFLIRSRESTPGNFVLSVKHNGGVQHFSVLRDGAGKYFMWVVKFNTLNELVDFHRTSSVSRTEKILLRDMVQATEKEKIAEALFDFTAQEPGELNFKRGEPIRITDQSDGSWWTGVNVAGERGSFPASYVKLIDSTQ